MENLSPGEVFELFGAATDRNAIAWHRLPSKYTEPRYEHYESVATVTIGRVAVYLRLTWTELKIERGFAHFQDVKLIVTRADGLWQNEYTADELPYGKGLAASVKNYGTREKRRSEDMLLKWLRGSAEGRVPESETLL
jgi:hypothetical protein